MDPFEVYAYWDSKENQPQLTLNTEHCSIYCEHACLPSGLVLLTLSFKNCRNS